MSTDVYTTTWEMATTEPIEIRFHSKKDRKWQLLVSVSTSGTLVYRLESVPHGNYSYSLSYLIGKTEVHMPMKARENWQTDVLVWLESLELVPDEPCYTIDEVL